MTDKLIEDRLAASLRFDAFNGNSMERSIAIGQVREAVQELRALRPLIAAVPELRDALRALHGAVAGEGDASAEEILKEVDAAVTRARALLNRLDAEAP